jgi:hypothetical protein
MELPRCSWCGEDLPDLYLFTCGELACTLHVVSPWCSNHPEDILITSIVEDQKAAHLLRMMKLSGKSQLVQELWNRIKVLQKPVFWKCPCGYFYNLSTKVICDYCKAGRSG